MEAVDKVKSPYPILSIIGRPNVGKSTLFNRLVGRRKAIVQEESGTTRDRVFQLCDWEGHRFNLVDTGGMQFDKKSSMDSWVDREVEKAIEQSDAIIMVIDGKAGVTALDDEIAAKVRRLKKPIVLAANKLDVEHAKHAVAPFFKLGLGQPEALSALHGLGVGDLMDRATKKLPFVKETPLTPNFTLSIVGEPNAGKSTLLNAYLKEERSIVSDIAGTTRDSVEEVIKYKSHFIRIVDTAGIRHARKIKDASTFFSLSRAKKSIQDSDVTFLLFEALKGIRKDTKAIARVLETERKPVILVANKWDLTSGVEQARYEADMKKELGFLKFAPLVFLSAKNGRNLPKLLDDGIKLWKTSAHHIPTPKLNDFLDRVKRRRLPSPAIRLKFLTQTSAIPQEFICFVKRKELIPTHYKRHLENELTEKFGLQGVPIRLRFREDVKKDA